MKINFVITAFDKEIYLPHLLKVIQSYRKIEPEIVIAYNGSQTDFPCTVRRPNMGHQHGDHDLTVTGFNLLKAKNDTFRFIKIGIDTFLLDESKLIKIFNVMEQEQACYAGNRWGFEEENSYSTDVIFMDTRFGDPFNLPYGLEKEGPAYEWWLYDSIQRRNLKIHIIEERRPVHPDNRNKCEALKWTMHHQLENNLEDIKKWGF